MTSRISFSNLVRSEMKKMNWLLAVLSTILGLLMPFRVLLILAVRASEEAKYGTGWNIPQIYGTLVGFDQIENTLVILAAGILCAVTAFSYLHSSVKLDFYHSLPMKRERLFAVKLMSSTIVFVIPYVLCQGLNVVIGMCYGAANVTIAAEILVDTLMGILQFLCSYAGTLLAIMLTGKMVTTFFAVITLGAYVPLAYVLFMGLKTLFLYNSLTDFDHYSSTVLYCSSPWAFCFYGQEAGKNAVKGMTGYWPGLANLCQMVAVIVILMMICVCLYRKRRTEAAGSALAFRKTEGVIKILLTVPASLVAAIVACDMLESLVWELVFIVLVGVLACVIMEFIYRADIRQVLSHKFHMVITVVLAAGVFLFAKYDMTGYNSYVPAKEEIAAMAMMDNMLRIQYDLGEGYPNYYRTSFTEELLDYMETEEFDPFYDLAAEGASLRENEVAWGDVWRVGVKYRLKNGKEVYRAYWVDYEKYLEVMDTKMQDPQFREKRFPILTWEEQMVKGMSANIWLPDTQTMALYHKILKIKEEDSEEISSSYSEEELANADYLITNEILSSDELWRVVQAYQKDLGELTYSEIQSISGELNFQWNEREQVYYGDYPLNMKFTHTMEALAEALAE